MLTQTVGDTTFVLRHVEADTDRGGRCWQLFVGSPDDPEDGSRACTDGSFRALEADPAVANVARGPWMAVGGPVAGAVADVRVTVGNQTKIVRPVGGFFLVAFQAYGGYKAEALDGDGKVLQVKEFPAPPTGPPDLPSFPPPGPPSG